MTASTPADNFGWFSPQDFEFLLQAINRHPDPKRFILVGGQALVGWALYYKIQIPLSTHPTLTEDADFLAKREEAVFLANEIGATVRVATMDDFTPNTAVVSWVSPTSGKILMVDFLANLIGVETDDVAKLAVPMQFDGQSTVYMLHPLLCIVSRFANLHRLREKRTRNGITQAQIAVEVARRFITEQLDSDAPDAEKRAIKSARRIAHLSRSEAGIFAFTHYDIDAMEAVPIERFQHPQFLARDWPNNVKWATREREKARKAYEAQQLRELHSPKHRP